MQIHEKILQKVNIQKKNFFAHLSKYQKKYIFSAGVALGIAILKVMLILGAFIATDIILGKLAVSNEKLKVYKSVETVLRIDDLAHREIDAMTQKNTISEENKKIFSAIDTRFHYAKDLNARYTTAREMVDFLLEVLKDQSPEIIGRQNTSNPETNELHELLLQFYLIK